MALPRHRTLRATLEWSHELLGEPERKLFRRLSVFAGGLTLEAAEAVGEGDSIEQHDILDLLSKLVDKSLVVTEASPGEEGALRHRMLEPIRRLWPRYWLLPPRRSPIAGAPTTPVNWSI